jgi:hypothetical protein
MSSTQITKSDKQELYKSLLDNKVLKIYEIDEKPRIPKSKYDVNLENITKLFITTASTSDTSTPSTTLQNLIINTLRESVKQFDTTSYLLLSLSPIWNYLLGQMQTITQKHTSITWSAETSRIRHTSTKFGTKSILFIDRLTKDTIEKVRDVFKLCVKNGLKYDTMIVLFYDEDGYEELMKYYKQELQIVPILRMSVILNYYETSKLVNDYLIESVKFQQETTYNDVIRILKNEHRIGAKTFNYQSKYAKYVTNNKHLLNLLNIYNVDITIDDLDFIKYCQKHTQLTDNEKKTAINKKSNNNSTKSTQNKTPTPTPIQSEKLSKYNNSIPLIENIKTSFNYYKLVINTMNVYNYERFSNILTTLISIRKKIRGPSKVNFTGTFPMPNFTLVISVDLLKSLSPEQLYKLVTLKHTHGFQFILDIPSYEIRNINLEKEQSIIKDIITKYNLDSLLTIQNDYVNNNNNTNININTNKNGNNEKTGKTQQIQKQYYKNITGIIDNIIITLNADTQQSFEQYINILQKSRSSATGIILRISDNSLNIDNYLANSKTWNAFNEFIVEEEGKHNINITGLIISGDMKFTNFEFHNALSLINDYTQQEFKDNTLLLKVKKQKGFVLNIVNEDTFYKFTKFETAKTETYYGNYISKITLDNMKFKKVIDEEKSKKEQEALDNIDDNLNKDKGDKNKELLEDEDEYAKEYILQNLISRMNITCKNTETLKDGCTVYDTIITNKYKRTNSYITWYEKTLDDLLKSVTMMDNVKSYTLKWIATSFDYVSSFFSK